jgi:glycosyltransferase involved in cell wall biosynthesis
MWLNKVEPLREALWRAFLQKVEKRLCDSNDVLIVHSLYAKRLLHKYYGVDRDKVTIIQHGALLISSPKDKERLKEILNLPQDAVVILSGGGIYPRKGLDDLLLAFSKVKEKAFLVILGDGPYLGYLKQLAQDLRVNERVRFTGYVSDNVMADYFKACDFVVLAKKSSFGETSGMLVNALAFGKPVIATDVGANRELVINQENGFLIQPRDVECLKLAMSTLIETPHLGAKMGEKSLEMAKNLDWDVVCGQIEEVYKNALC